MARIAEAELERLRASVLVAELVASDGVVLVRRGADLVGLCPLHADETPSLVVTPGKNLWHCFGCGAGGGPLDWVMKRRGVSFRHAVELLRESHSSLAAASGVAAPPAPARKLAVPVSADEDDAAVLDRVVSYYQACLARSPAALTYLEARGIADPEAVATFRLGFADRTLGLRLPDKRRREGAELRSRLERLGLYRSSGHEHFSGSLVIPVLDEAGGVAGMYGRKITAGLRAGTSLHLYLPGPHRGVWNLPGVAAAGAAGLPVILCEALIDALTFWCAGFRGVTSAYGAEGLTEAHLEAFARHGVRQVLIAFDRDEAGDRGAAKAAERLGAVGIGCWRVLFPKGMDANAYALKVMPAAKSLGLLLRQAVWMGEGDAPARPMIATEDRDAPARHLAASSPAPAAPPEGEPPADPPLPLAAADLPAATAVPGDPAPPPADASQAAKEEGGGMPPPAPPSGTREPAVVEASRAEAVIRIGSRRYRARGLDRAAAGGEALKVNLMTADGDAFHVDSLDLYSARARAVFVEAASAELDVPASVLKAELGRVLLEIEGVLEARAAERDKPAPPPEAAMTEAEREAALAFLRQPDLLVALSLLWLR
jgi:DNA primase catalytic core